MHCSTVRLTVLFLLLGALPLFGQTKKQYLQAAEEMWAEKNYYAALVYYKTVADAWPEETEVIYQTAEAARMYNSYLLAEKYYQQVIDADAEIKFPLARLHLAGVKRNLGQYAQAVSLYEEFDRIRPDKEHNCAQAIQSCRYALAAPKFHLPMELVPIALNTEYAEFAPVRIGDTLYYSSLNYPLEDKRAASQALVTRIYESSNDAFGNLLRAQMQEGNRHIAHTAFNFDQSLMLFSICQNVNASDYRCDLYAARRSADTWVTAERLPESINKPGYSASQPTYARLGDGREGLFYASDAPGGKGKMDIWFVEINAAGQYGTPVNMAMVNTPDNDITPYFHEPSQRLFFASEGLVNLGGYDIYETRFAQGRWTTPQGLPMPFNSSYNDLYFSMTDDGAYMYLASNRDTPGTKYIDPELQSCCNDIFRATYTREMELIANAFDDLQKLPLAGTTIRLQRLSGNEWVDVESKQDPGTHTHSFGLNPGQEYRIIGEKPGYLPDTVAFSTHDWNQTYPLVKDLFLKQQPVELEVFTFDEVSRKPLESSTVRLYDITDPDKPRLIDEATRTGDNRFPFSLLPNRKYEIRGSADGYMEALDRLDTYVIPPDGKMRRDLYLRYKTLEEYLPLAVYFDNDLPGRRQRTTTTRISYEETYGPYLERENEYVSVFSSVLTEQEQSIVRGEIRRFFQEEVKQGLRELNNFCEAIQRDLGRGNQVTVTIEGFTSPRAEEYYNQKLGGRRASSVQNFIESWQGGVLRPFLKSGQLQFEPISWGETRAREGVSDDLRDERLSIYAVEAARERRAEINNVKVIPKK